MARMWHGTLSDWPVSSPQMSRRGVSGTSSYSRTSVLADEVIKSGSGDVRSIRIAAISASGRVRCGFDGVKPRWLYGPLSAIPHFASVNAGLLKVGSNTYSACGAWRTDGNVFTRSSRSANTVASTPASRRNGRWVSLFSTRKFLRVMLAVESRRERTSGHTRHWAHR